VHILWEAKTGLGVPLRASRVGLARQAVQRESDLRSHIIHADGFRPHYGEKPRFRCERGSNQRSPSAEGRTAFLETLKAPK